MVFKGEAMKINYLGPIDDAELSFNKLNVFYGKNNSGKTYLSYALYGIMKHVFNKEYLSVVEEIKIPHFDEDTSISIPINIEIIINKITNLILKDVNENFRSILARTFAVSESEFKKTLIELTSEDVQSLLVRDVDSIEPKVIYRFRFHTDLVTFQYDKAENSMRLFRELNTNTHKIEENNLNPEDEIPPKLLKKIMSSFLKKILFIGSNPFYLPAERNGANVFRDEINIQRSNLISENSEDKLNTIFRYPAPISDYLVFLNSINNSSNLFSTPLVTDIMKNNTSRTPYIRSYIQNVLKGQYVYRNNILGFRRLITKSKTSALHYKAQEIPFNITSSSVKSLYGLSDYISNPLVNSDNIAFMDEPEMNLDPEKQVELATILVDLVNAGKFIFISTHSDYIFRKLSNSALKDHIEKKSINIVSYQFNNGKVSKINNPWTEDYVENFDSPLEKLNEEYNDLYEKLDSKEQNYD